MARPVKLDEFAAKRKEILDAAHTLVFTKGFDRMSIRDIQEQLNISSGAFHHYFGSREALLEAFIERIKEESGKPLLPIINDPRLTAVEKLQGFFNTLDSLRTAQQAQVLNLLKVWYTDGNALVRQKVDDAVFEQRVPMINAVVQQGIREGVFSTAFPQKAGEVILSLLQGMGTTHAKLLLAAQEAKSETNNRISELVNNIVTTHSAYMDAIERLLGAPPNSLYRADVETVQAWVTAMRSSEKEQNQ